jgi:hypothetical protein
MGREYDFERTPELVSKASSTLLKDDQTTPVNIPCKAISVDTNGVYVVNGVSTYLTKGVIHFISVKVAVTGAGSIAYWY